MTSVRDELEIHLREAKRELQELGKQLDQKPEFGLGKGSTGVYSWEMALARRERVTVRIKDLQKALDRVREGTYGRCDGCGVQIAPERLEILPTTTLCAVCACAAGATPMTMPGASAPVTVQK
jgi:RNA polymerase-binding transcription factor DksA